MTEKKHDFYIYDPSTYRDWVKSYQDNDDPLGWFEPLYKGAQGDHKKVFWADLEPNPYLVKWVDDNETNPAGKKAIVIGCGVGDDAEVLSEQGYDVIAFDISSAAIDLCKHRYPDTKVHYKVADLFNVPKEWQDNFDLVFECNTIQVLPGNYRILARNAMISLLAPGGCILVSCRSRKQGELEDAIPLPLDHDEINGFCKEGNLKEVSFEAYDDNQTPPVPHFFACYQRVFNSDAKS